MAKLELVLHNEDGDVTYTQDYVPAKKYLEFLDMQNEISEKTEKGDWTVVNAIEAKLKLVASLFDNKAVTPEALLEGVSSWDLMDTIDSLLAKMAGWDKGSQEGKK